MKIRKAKREEVEQIKQIYVRAKNYMNENGNFSQWNNNFPPKELILSDIEAGNLYVCVDEDKIAGVFCFFIGVEPTYNKIYDGKWLNESEYAVIHRVAIDIHNKGIASFCIKWCINQYGNIKIDTHRDNIPMQKTILKNGFSYCGIIKKEDGTERLAYQICV